MAESDRPDRPSPPDSPAPGTPPTGRPAQPNGDDEQRRLGSAAAGAGMQFVVSILVFVYAGQWLDRKFGTDPLWLLVGLFLGAGGSFVSLYRRLMAAQSKPPSKSRPEP